MIAELPAPASAEEEALRGAVRAGEAGPGIAEQALLLAAIDRPETDPAPYRAHLRALAAEARAGAAAETVEGAARALAASLFDGYGYDGDRDDYEHPDNANLMRVIDRRRGIPVSLGILCLHWLRAGGRGAVGLAFPGHFLIRIEDSGGRAILDPFHRCRTVGSGDLRDLLKATAGPEAELLPHHHAAVSDAEVLLRLENNVKLRAFQRGDVGRAIGALRAMLILAPDSGGLLRELAILSARRGSLRDAAWALARFLERSPPGAEREEASALLASLRGRLN